eukprot:g69707.t1
MICWGTDTTWETHKNVAIAEIKTKARTKTVQTGKEGLGISVLFGVVPEGKPKNNSSRMNSNTHPLDNMVVAILKGGWREISYSSRRGVACGRSHTRDGPIAYRARTAEHW